MTPEQYKHYRWLCETHRMMEDHLVVVDVSDLTKLLDAYEASKPRVKVKAASCPSPS